MAQCPMTIIELIDDEKNLKSNFYIFINEKTFFEI